MTNFLSQLPCDPQNALVFDIDLDDKFEDILGSNEHSSDVVQSITVNAYDYSKDQKLNQIPEYPSQPQSSSVAFGEEKSEEEKNEEHLDNEVSNHS